MGKNMTGMAICDWFEYLFHFEVEYLLLLLFSFVDILEVRYFDFR